MAMGPRVKKMEEEQQALKKNLAQLEDDYEPIDLHPGAAEKYKRIMSNLQEHLNNIEDLEDRDAIFTQIRELIERVIITPTGARKPVDIVVEGRLATLLSVSGLKEDDGFRVTVVAGAGFELYM
jgi:hypothetical protein